MRVNIYFPISLLPLSPIATAIEAPPVKTASTAAAAYATTAAAAVITPAAQIPFFQERFAASGQQKRQDSGDAVIWGYIGGNPASPLACSGTYTPRYFNNLNDAVGCCDGAGICDGADWRTCNPLGGTVCPDTDFCSELYTSVLSCSARSSQFCISYFLRTCSVPGCTSGYRSYACGTRAALFTVLATATDDQDSGTSSRSRTFSSASGSTAGHGTSDSSTHTGSTSSIDAGAVAGGTIGGVAGILLIIYVAVAGRKKDWLWLLHRRQTDPTQSDNGGSFETSSGNSVPLHQYRPGNEEQTASVIDGPAQLNQDTINRMQSNGYSS